MFSLFRTRCDASSEFDRRPYRFFEKRVALAWAGWSIAACVSVFVTTPAMAQEDRIRSLAEMQQIAATTNAADWAHWGPNSEKYSSWGTHSNRLVPIYTFGGNLGTVSGEQSLYRDEARIRSLYGALPEETFNPAANYLDQTDVFRLQQQAVAEGKKRIILFVFDGMDWQTTRAAAIVKTGTVAYEEGRGTGLLFQDYAKAETDFGEFVCSPHNNGTNIDVNKQQISNPGGKMPGGYSPGRAGPHAWSTPENKLYIIGKDETLKQAYTDSAASATSMTSGIKTYNNAINVDFSGREVLPIARVLQEQGFAVGAVSSVPFNHATPACAYANNVHRGDYQDIARDMLGLPSVFHPGGLPGLDVVIGAGWGEKKETDGGQGENYVAGNRYITAKDIKNSRAANGGDYVVVTRKAGRDGKKVIASGAKRAKKQGKGLFGFFGVSGGHLPFQTADGDYQPVASIGNEKTAAAETYSTEDLSENPTLGDMAMAALDVLSGKSEKLWLLVEAGDVDWANHANNLDNSIGAVLSGESAFAKVTGWIEGNGGWEETLVILTADHGHYLVLDQPERLIAE